MKVALVGGPGLGKTTAAMGIAAELKRRGVVATFVGEYARTWMAKHKRTPRAVEDQALIMRGQRRRETEAELTQDVVITDSTTWMCAVYSTTFLRNTQGKIDESGNISLNDVFEDALSECDNYDLVFVLPRCFDIQKEPGRLQSSLSECEKVDAKILGFIHLFDIPHITLSDNPKKWVDEVVENITGRLGIREPLPA